MFIVQATDGRNRQLAADLPLTDYSSSVSKASEGLLELVPCSVTTRCQSYQTFFAVEVAGK
jgi:hypothetical protein